MEKRKFQRFDPTIEITGDFEVTKELTGHFRNLEKFQVKNVSIGGFNLLSNFSPSIGKNYQIYIDYADQRHELEVAIVHSRVFKLLSQTQGIFNPGVVFSIGCQTLYGNRKQKDLVLEIIKNSCGTKAG